MPLGTIKTRLYVRVAVENIAEAQSVLESVFGKLDYLNTPAEQNTLAFITPYDTENILRKKLSLLKTANAPAVFHVVE